MIVLCNKVHSYNCMSLTIIWLVTACHRPTPSVIWVGTMSVEGVEESGTYPYIAMSCSPAGNAWYTVVTGQYPIKAVDYIIATHLSKITWKCQIWTIT